MIGRALIGNMRVIANTIRGVVDEMRPTIICLCEVGEVNIPLTGRMMEQMATGLMGAWRDAAT